ncbi:MAG: extracellular solute-binding protein [Actinomycetota bacterium]|nr:extracellular solute-binding protein [Actinomycetota bacterium]
MRFRPGRLSIAVALLPLMTAFAACQQEGQEAGDDESASATDEITITAVYTGAEQEAFEAVLDDFMATSPGIEVKYRSAGDELPTVLETAVRGGNPPDLAMLPQPGVVADFAARGELQPLDFAREAVAANLGEYAVQLGTVDGEFYGFLVLTNNGSPIWYNVDLFEQAGVNPPATWEELLDAAETLKASGVSTYSFGGADGWTLSAIFENIYLRTAGPEKYDELAKHEIPWTHPSVKEALRYMGQLFEDPDNIAGGPQGALETDFPTSVTQVFSDPPKAALTIIADFAYGVITDSTSAKPVSGFNVFDFPSIEGSEPAVVGGGDSVVMFTDSDAARSLVEYLTTAEAAKTIVTEGPWSSLHTGLDPSVYPDPIRRGTGAGLLEAETFRFYLADLQPPEFGATVGQGLWKLFQDFLLDPGDVDGTAAKMEKAAAEAFE